MKLKLPKLGKKPKLPYGGSSKKWMIPVIAVAVVAVGAGIFALTRKSGGSSVYVYSIDIAGMTDYWGDSQETSGQVRSDNIQTVMVSDTQQITGIHVAEGDTVKKGDLLLSYDTTLTELALEKKRLAVEQLKLELQEEQDRLTEIRNLQPFTPVENSGSSGTYDIPAGDDFTYEHFPYYTAGDDTAVITWATTFGGYDGSTKDTPLICWTKYGNIVDDSLVNEMGAFIQRYRYLMAEDEYNQKLLKFQQDHAAWEAEDENTRGEEPTAPEKPQEGSFAVQDFYMIVKSTYDNKTLYYNAAYQGMHVYPSSSGFFFIPFDASDVYDYTRPEEETPPASGDDADTGETQTYYTLAEIVKMKEDQQKKILDVEYKIKVAQAEYDIAVREANDGNVTAQVDGKVVSVITEEEAKANKQPIIKVSGGGGYTVTGSINELDMGKLEIGSEVTINDYRNGTSCTGTVASVGDFPVSSGGSYYGSSNPNASQYPFTVVVDESEDLVPGYYVNMSYSLTDSTDSIYLSNAFIRTENGRSYVYVRGENGKLEQRDVVIGKNVWGSYTQILSGITTDDFVAFPYGKAVKAGASTETGDYQTLYQG